ncbi:MAG TPA: alpha/beta fold hydrolase [Anaerolineales bacterium]|nr:alpha/beta fold hydrolase [Anaerolineales bacterium]
MRTILLPGYSPRNREWAEELAAEIPGAEMHPWPHWETGGTLDAAAELAAIKKRIGADTVNLLAKSVGCRIAARILRSAPEQIHKLVLCGLPSTQVEARADFSAALARLPAERVLVVQNRLDPYATFKEVQAMIQGILPGVRLVEGDRDDHHYPYPEVFRGFLEESG